MGGEWMEIGFSFHFEEVDGGRMEDDSPSNQAKIGQLVRRKKGFWVCHRGQPNLPTSRPYVLNPCRYTRTSPERVQNESRTKIKIKMMNRNVSEAPSQRIIVIQLDHRNFLYIVNSEPPVVKGRIYVLGQCYVL